MRVPHTIYSGDGVQNKKVPNNLSLKGCLFLICERFIFMILRNAYKSEYSFSYELFLGDE